MTFLIDFGIKSALALAVAFLVVFILRRGSASVRYALWTCALAAVLVLPLASWIGPKWNVVTRRHALQSSTTAPAEEQAPSIAVVVHARRPIAPELPVILWIAGAIAMFARVAAGHWRVRSLFGTAEEIRDSRWLAIAQETAAGIGFRRAVILKRSTATDVPLSYGLVCATLLLPGESEHWTEERRRVVLSHEMIHARRLDSLWGLLAQCALAVNWFNPLAWFAARQFRKEQERSCDDAVVEAGTASTVYAGHLVDLARSIAIPEPALGMAERFDLEGRVQALLDPSRNRTMAGRAFCSAMLAGTLALILPLAAIRAQSSSKAPSIDQSSAAFPIAAVLLNSPVDTKKEVAMVRPARRAPARARSAMPEEPQAAPLGSIAGSIYDPSGAVIQRAQVSVKNTANSNEEVAFTDAAGLYKLQRIPAGEYVVKATARGFATYQKTVSIEAGVPATVDVHLAIGSGEEAMIVTAKRPDGTAPSDAPTRRIRVGGMVQAYSLIRKVVPVYPSEAKAEGVEGTVVLHAIVSKTGSLLSVTPVNTGIDPRLVSAAVESVSQWQYKPTLLNGEPVEVITTVTVSFQLN